MLLQVYEYTIKDKLAGTYKGSFTLPVNSPNKADFIDQYQAKLVGEFEHESY